MDALAGGIWHIGRFVPELKEAPHLFCFILNIVVPGLQLVVVWGSSVPLSEIGAFLPFQNSPLLFFRLPYPPHLLSSPLPPLDPLPSRQAGARPCGRLFNTFVKSGSDFRNQRFKLIPNIPNGSWIIRSAVGSSPVLLGTKLRCVWFRTPTYLEVTVDLNSSRAAMAAVNLVQGITKSLVIDMAVLVEGRGDDELPEVTIGST